MEVGEEMQQLQKGVKEQGLLLEGKKKNRSFSWKEEKEQGFLLAVKCISYERTHLVLGVLG